MLKVSPPSRFVNCAYLSGCAVSAISAVTSNLQMPPAHQLAYAMIPLKWALLYSAVEQLVQKSAVGI